MTAERCASISSRRDAQRIPSGFSFLKTVMQVVGIVMMVFAPEFAYLWQQMLWGFASGFLASGGNLRAGLAGAVGGVLFNAIGGMKGLDLFERAILHGAAGGAMSAVGGGQFQDGFLGSFAGAALSPGIEKAFGAAGTGGTVGKLKRVVSAAVVGGVSSRLGGGKFQNGAVTAAFGRLFNHETATRSRTTGGSLGRPLSDAEKDSYRGMVSDEALEQAHIIERGIANLLPREFSGITLGRYVYLKPGRYTAETADGFELLAHELVHVEQNVQGRFSYTRYLIDATRVGYDSIPLETEAYRRQYEMRSAYCSANPKVPGC